MLGHWHGQERRIGDAASRRFLGVVGQGHAQVSATVILQSAQQPQLSLVVCNARHDVGARDVSELAIGGVDAVAAASPLPDDLLLPACVAGRAAASQVVSFIHDITPAQLVAVGFVEPVLHDHALTGQVLALPRGAGQLRLRLLQVFALDHINATEPDQMLVQQADDAVHNDVPIYLPLLDVMQRFDEARLAELAAAPAAAGGGDVPAAGGQGAGGHVVLQAPLAMAMAPPAGAPAAALLAAHFAQAASPAPAVAGMGGAVVAHAGQPPLHPGPAPFIPPQAFGAPHHVHWAADVAGNSPAAGPQGGIAAPPGFGPGFGPAAPPGPGSAAPFGSAPPPPPASGIPLGAARAPLPIDMSVIPNTVRLFAQCLPDDMTHIDSLDTIVRILAPAGQTPPMSAFLPVDDPMARLEYIEHRLLAVLQHMPMPNLRPRSGLAGVYQACRAFSRVSTLPASSSTDLSSSFGRSAERHLNAQAQVFTPGAVAQPSAEPPLDPLHAAAIRAAGVAVDQEGSLPPMQRQMSTAAASLAQAVPDSGGVSQPLSVVRSLGSALARLPSSLQILESASGRNFSATSSAHMIALTSHLNSATNSFYPMAAEKLREKIGKEPPLLSEARVSALRSSVSFVLRGKPLSVTEAMLCGQGESDLLAALRSGDVSRAKEVLMWMDFIVRLFWPQLDIAVDNGDGHTFFSFAADRVGVMLNVEKHSPAIVADYVQHRMRAIQDDFKRFYSGALLLRPRYSAQYFSGSDATAALAEISRMHHAQQVPNLAASVAEQLRSMGWQPPAAPSSSAAASPAPAPAPSKRASKRQKAAAAAAAAASAPAPAPAAPPPVAPVAPEPSAPAAPVAPPVPVINGNGVIGGTVHQGAASGAMMAAFSQANLDSSGNGRCFNFWRRGQCRNGSTCRFSHV